MEAIVHLWVDSAIVGCGERLFVVVKTGPKFAHLFDPNQLKSIQVERSIFDRHARPANVKPHLVRRRLRMNALHYRRFKLHYSKKAVQAAEQVLGEI